MKMGTAKSETFHACAALQIGCTAKSDQINLAREHREKEDISPECSADIADAYFKDKSL